MSNAIHLPFRGIKHRLIIAICLMSVIPILICLNFIFPSILHKFISKADLALIVSIMMFIVLLGFMVIKQIIDSIVKISRDARSIAEGDTERRIEAEGDDEIGQLGSALNQMTARIKANMDELKDYGSETARINFEIQKKIIVMSGLLQISNLITQGGRLDDILNLCVIKVRGLADSSLGFILFLENGRFTVRAQEGLAKQSVEGVAFPEQDECIRHICKKNTATACDANNFNASSLKLLSAFGVKNLLCLPIFLSASPIAVFGIGNNADNFSYSREDIELLDIFAKQVTIASENDLLIRKIEKLEVRDMLTGLYNEQYIRNRLDEEINRAITYQRPCGFILAKIVNFSAYQKSNGQVASEAAFKKIASCLGGAISTVERLGRFVDYGFAIILPEKNKRQAQKVAEELQKKVAAAFNNEADAKRLSIATAVAENPLDGSTSAELISFAQELLDKA